MAKRSQRDSNEGVDRVLRALEAELATATERFRIAKLAAKQAKAEAKVAKKDMKHARTALAAAQDEHDKALLISSKGKAATPRKRAKAKSKAVSRKVHSQIAGTPENTRKPQLAKKRRAPSGPSSGPAVADAPAVEASGDFASDPNPDSDVPITGDKRVDYNSSSRATPDTGTITTARARRDDWSAPT